MVLCPGFITHFNAIRLHLEDAHLILEALQGVIKCTTLFCELGGKVVNGVCAGLLNGRDALANRVYSSQRLSLKGRTFLVH